MQGRTLFRGAVELVLTAFLAATEARAQTGRLSASLRLDANREDFPAFIRILISPHRQIVVTLVRENQFRVYDSTGKRIAALGRTGSGPGEFRQIGGAGWIADTMWIFDVTLRRTTFIGPDWKIMRTTVEPTLTMPSAPTSSNSGGLFLSPMIRFTDGSVLGRTQTPTASGASTWESFIAIQSPTGRLTRVKTSPNFEDPHWFMFAGPFGRSVPFTVSPQVAFALDGSRYGYLVVDNASRDGGTYTVSTYRANGDVIFKSSFPFVGVPIPGHVRDSAIGAEIPAGGSESSPALNRQFQSQARERTPHFYAPVEELVFGLDGTSWLIGRLTETGRLVTVLNNAGTVVGTVTVPPNSRLRQATRSQLWVTERDDDGLVSVVGYRLTGLGSGAR